MNSIIKSFIKHDNTCNKKDLENVQASKTLNALYYKNLKVAMLLKEKCIINVKYLENEEEKKIINILLSVCNKKGFKIEYQTLFD